MDCARKIAFTITDGSIVQNESKLIDFEMRIEKLEQFYHYDSQIFWEIRPSIFAYVYSS